MSKKTELAAAKAAATTSAASKSEPPAVKKAATDSLTTRGIRMAAENPLGLALGAAALGFLAGLVVPITDYEREKVGPIRDDLLDRAQHLGADAFEHGKAVITETAQAALQTAQESAQRHAQQVVSEANAMGDHMSNGNSTPTNNQGDTADTANVSYGVLDDEDAEADAKPAAKPAAV